MAYDVAIVGGGPAGLSAAIALANGGVSNVVVLERESQAGGAPRHTDHLGFGMRDLHRLMSGPRYAAELRDRALRAGVEVRTSTTALAWAESDSVGMRALQIADPNGLSSLETSSLLLATGVRERPRSARLVAGDRGAGIFTTGALQQLTALHQQRPGQRAVIVGAEHVSFSAVLTLRHAGCEVAAMITSLPRHQTHTLLAAATARRHRVPIVVDDTVVDIHGRGRVEAVTLQSGRRIACDTVVFTGDWIPDHELARHGGVIVDFDSKAVVVDQHQRTNQRGVFAVGNLTHPAETADRCARDGHRVAAAITQWEAAGIWPASPLGLLVEAPLLWVSPSRWDTAIPASQSILTLRIGLPAARSAVEIWQGPNRLWAGRPRGALVPNRSISIPTIGLQSADPSGPSLLIRVQT